MISARNKNHRKDGKMKIEKIKAACIAASSALFNWLGVLAVPLLILLACNGLDYYTGIKAAPERNPNDERPIKSYKSIRGITKKVCMYILIIIGWFMDMLIKYTLSELIEINIPPIFAITVTCWLVFNEMISILENMDDMGVEIPPFLLPLMRKIKGQVEEKTKAE